MLIRSVINENRIFHSDSMQIGPRSKMRVSTFPIIWSIRMIMLNKSLHHVILCVNWKLVEGRHQLSVICKNLIFTKNALKGFRDS